MAQENFDERFVELLQLSKLTANEAKALLYIASSDEKRPLEISKHTQIPQSKIYEIMNNLVQKKFLIKKGKEYDFNHEVLIEQKNNFQKTLNDFSNFLKELSGKFPSSEEQYSKEIANSLTTLGFTIDSNGRLDPNSEAYYGITSSIKHRMKSSLPWLVGVTSINTDLRIGIVIMNQTFTQKTTNEFDSFIVRAVLSEKHFDQLFFIGKNIPNIIKDIFQNAKFISTSDNYLSQLENELEELDQNLRQAKKTLERIELLIEEPYERISEFTSDLLNLNYAIDKVLPKKIKEKWLITSLKDVIERFEVDGKALSESYINAKLQFKTLQKNLTESRRTPRTGEINSLYSKIETINENIGHLEQELGSLHNEVFEIYRGKTYSKLGFITNPFVFTIPVETRLDIIGQETAISELDEFLQSIAKGTPSTNTAFVVDVPGMGKTHLMKYFNHKLNSGKIPNSIGLYFRCRTGSDLISIYNDLRIATEKLPDSKMKSGFLAFLSKTEPPQTLNQIISLLRGLSQLAYDIENRNLVLFIDEFENLLTSGLQLSTSIEQLKQLLQTPRVGFVIVIRQDYWKKLSESKNFISESTYEQILLKKFEQEQVEKLLNKRLQDYNIEDDVKVRFSTDAIKKITQKSHGNVRNIISLARDAFRKSLFSNKTVIDVDSLVDTMQTKLPTEELQ